MPRKNGKWRKKPCIGEELRIALHLAIKDFQANEDKKELEFPSSLTSEERAYIHALAAELGLKSKSRGQVPLNVARLHVLVDKGSSRFLTVYKRDGSTIVQSDSVIQLSRQARHQICTLLQKFPVTSKEKQDLLPLTERDRTLGIEVFLPSSAKESGRVMGRLTSGVPQIPPKRGRNLDLQQFRESLPIWPFREEILAQIGSNTVTMITGETGSGKTTQVGQFILEQCEEQKRPCRIVCTQPRRLAALSLSDRVAAERDEKVGHTVGYQIRLESRVSPRTLLTYCTHGVLLRTLMGGCDNSGAGNVLASMTHILVDEVHERNKQADFLLSVLRDQLPKFRALRLVLMSATLDTDLFTRYFHGCPLVTVPGRMFPVKEKFLEDIFIETKYMSEGMKKAQSESEVTKRQQKQLEEWTSGTPNVAAPPRPIVARKGSKPEKPILGACKSSEPVPEKTDLEPWLVEQLDHSIEDAWLTGSEDAFSQLLHLILTYDVSVDYQHGSTSATGLMVAAGRGNLPTVEHLLSLGASTTIRASNGWTVLDWAKHTGQEEALLLIQAYMRSLDLCPSTQELVDEDKELTPEEKELLELYHQSFNDDRVDIDLCMTVVHNIHSGEEEGAVLVFLPGYDEIVQLRERILAEDRKLQEAGKYALFTLHSHMQSSDQRRVFRATAPGVRKIVLATNIAETSITINDIVFVIDSGKVKENSFDALSGASMLKTGWLSRASAIQRAGRAGRLRPGVVFRLFSRLRYTAFQERQTAEILRTPLQELCLYSKSLAPPNTPVAEFLSRVPEPPPSAVTRGAVQLLKTMDALDAWEDLTELGMHLLELSVEPRLGKALLYACVLRCLDPVLTIVSCVAYRDPFLLPNKPFQKITVNIRRKKFSAGAFSDHMALLKVFQAWQKSRSDGWERQFCEKNFVSSSTMEMIVSMRSHLLGQLRASGLVRARGGGDIMDLNRNSDNWSMVKAALCAGMYPNIVRVDREHMQLRTRKESKVRLHPSSTLLDGGNSHRSATAAAAQSRAIQSLPTEWVIYDELSRVGHVAHVQRCTVVTGVTLFIFGGPMRLPQDSVTEHDPQQLDAPSAATQDSDSESEEHQDGCCASVKIDEWILFRMRPEVAQAAVPLREKWHSLVLRRLRAPQRPWSAADDMVVSTLSRTLADAEAESGLLEPTGVGQRPRPVGGDLPRGGEEPPPEDMMIPDEELHLNTRYFVIKASSQHALDLSADQGHWSFTLATERRMERVLRERRIILLVFSVHGSGHFQGYARLLRDLCRETEGTCTEPSASPNMSAPYRLQWIRRGNLPFQLTRHLQNPYNENKKVQISRDGQELEPSVGEALCRLWDQHTPMPDPGHNRPRYTSHRGHDNAPPIPPMLPPMPPPHMAHRFPPHLGRIPPMNMMGPPPVPFEGRPIRGMGYGRGRGRGDYGGGYMHYGGHHGYAPRNVH